jgi:hypothetical protein
VDLAEARRTLLGVPPAAFVAERERLAKELAAAGQKKEAAELKKLRKPPVTVWALNQVAVREPELMAQVLEAGARMVAVHEALAAGRASADFRETSAGYRRAIAAVVAAVDSLLRVEGLSVDAATLRRVERTLEAAAFAGEEQQEALRQGLLAEELERADPFDTERFEVVPGAPSRPRPKPAPEPVAKAPKVDERAERAEREARAEAERQAKARRAAAADARRAAERAERAAAAAQERLAAAEAALATAHERAEAARAEAAEAETRATEARQAADQAEKAIDAG